EPERNVEEAPQHLVDIARPFAVGKFEMTVDQFAAFVKDADYDAGSACSKFVRGNWEEHAGHSWRDPRYPQTGPHPAVCISWADAKAYVAWLSRRIGKPYRLLSEAEREYVARAGTTTPFWWGSSIATTNANYDGTATYGEGNPGQ